MQTIRRERAIVNARLREKRKLKQAHRQITQLLIASSATIFLTLLFIWAGNNMPAITLPRIYLWNIPIIIVTSLLIVSGKRKIQLDSINQAFMLSGLALILGIIFSMIQLVGLQELLKLNEVYKNFLLPFSFLHFVHVVIGLVMLCMVFLRLKDFQIHSRAISFATNVFRFWHFLSFTWLGFMLIA